MSKNWDEYKYIESQKLWQLFDQMQHEIDLDGEDEIGKTSEAFKMFLMGQRQSLKKIVECVHGNEEELKGLLPSSSEVTPTVQLKTLDNDKIAEVYAEEWYATHGPIGRPIFSLDCREAFLAGFSIAMQLVKSQVALETVYPPSDTSTHFEPCVRLSKLPKQVRP